MTIVSMDSTTATPGADGEIALASGAQMGMRMWRDEQPHAKEPHRSPYETLGYVVSGRAELTIEGTSVSLKPGTSWLVPANSLHTYRILEPFTAIECTAPPQKRPVDAGQRGSVA
jgi:quercetin dioxygenase-like cupin family protein